MKKVIALFYCLYSLYAAGQTKWDTIPSVIMNSKTPRKVSLPGTRIYMDIPAGCKVASGFAGIQKGKDAYIQISEVYEGNYFASIDGYNPKAFEKAGATVIDWKELKFDGYPARYFHYKHEKPGYNLVFGDSTFFVILLLKYPEGDEATGKELRDAMLSLCYDKAKKVDPFEAAFFHLDEKNNKLKFSNFATNTYIYTTGGIRIKVYKDEPVFVASPMVCDKKRSLQAILESRIPLLQQAGLINFIIQNASSVAVNGNPTYSMEVYGNLNGKKVGYYLQVSSKGENAIELEGRAGENIPENINAFKALAHTVTLK